MMEGNSPIMTLSEIYTHVSKSNIASIKSPLDSILEEEKK